MVPWPWELGVVGWGTLPACLSGSWTSCIILVLCNVGCTSLLGFPYKVCYCFLYAIPVHVWYPVCWELYPTSPIPYLVKDLELHIVQLSMNQLACLLIVSPYNACIPPPHLVCIWLLCCTCRKVLDVIQHQKETTDLHEQFHSLVGALKSVSLVLSFIMASVCCFFP